MEIPWNFHARVVTDSRFERGKLAFSEKKILTTHNSGLKQEKDIILFLNL